MVLGVCLAKLVDRRCQRVERQLQVAGLGNVNGKIQVACPVDPEGVDADQSPLKSITRGVIPASRSPARIAFAPCVLPLPVWPVINRCGFSSRQPRQVRVEPQLMTLRGSEERARAVIPIAADRPWSQSRRPPARRHGSPRLIPERWPRPHQSPRSSHERRGSRDPRRPADRLGVDVRIVLKAGANDDPVVGRSPAAAVEEPEAASDPLPARAIRRCSSADHRLGLPIARTKVTEESEVLLLAECLQVVDSDHLINTGRLGATMAEHQRRTGWETPPTGPPPSHPASVPASQIRVIASSAEACQLGGDEQA